MHVLGGEGFTTVKYWLCCVVSIVSLEVSNEKEQEGQTSIQYVQSEEKGTKGINVGAKACDESHSVIQEQPDPLKKKGKHASRARPHTVGIPTCGR